MRRFAAEPAPVEDPLIDRQGIQVFIDTLISWGFQPIEVDRQWSRGGIELPFPLRFKGEISEVFIYWFEERPSAFEHRHPMSSHLGYVLSVQIRWNTQRTRLRPPYSAYHQTPVPLRWHSMIGAVKLALDWARRLDDSARPPESGVPPGMERPAGLTPEGTEAWKTLVAFFKKMELTYTGGGTAFYSPLEWAERREQYALDSLLIVAYDGGAHRDAMSIDADNYRLNQRMQDALGEKGFLFEEATGWYGGVYRL